MTIPQKAIEAAAEAFNPGLFTLTDHQYGIRFDNNPALRTRHQEDARNEARAALTAALPALEQQIRAQVAQEIRAYLDGFNSHGLPYRDGVYAGINSAAQIARGEQA